MDCARDRGACYQSALEDLPGFLRDGPGGDRSHSPPRWRGETRRASVPSQKLVTLIAAAGGDRVAYVTLTEIEWEQVQRVWDLLEEGNTERARISREAPQPRFA